MNQQQYNFNDLIWSRKTVINNKKNDFTSPPRKKPFQFRGSLQSTNAKLIADVSSYS